jgi:hypothetical protein
MLLHAATKTANIARSIFVGCLEGVLVGFLQVDFVFV